MAATTTIKITHGTEAKATIDDLFVKDATMPRHAALALARFFEAVAAGVKNASIEIVTDSSLATATGTLTCASVAQNDTFAINGVTVTMKNSGATGAQVNIGGSNSATASAIATFINGYSSFKGIVTASANGAVVTISAAQPGKLGNCVSLAGTAVRLAASGSALSSGAGRDTTATTYRRGV